MHTVFDTSDSFDRYHETTLQQAVPVRIRCAEPTGFWASTRTSQLGALSLFLQESRAQVPLEISRTSILIRRSDPEAYRLLLNLRGHINLTQHERVAPLEPGGMALYDTSDPFAGWRGSSETEQIAMVTFPRHLLPVPEGLITPALGAPLPGRSAIGRLLFDVLIRFMKDAGDYPASQTLQLATLVLDLIGLLLVHGGGDDVAAADSRQRTLLFRIQAFIQEHLNDPELSPQMIADRNHISVRYLQKLFQAEGLTVAGSIRDRRLDRCRRDLADPLLADTAVRTIASRWGFKDSAHFSHLFSSTFGISPQAFRREPAGEITARP